MKEPKMVLSKSELIEVLRYWKDKLFLNDWVIKIMFVEPNDIEGFAGINNISLENKSCLIKVAKKTEEEFAERITKMPMEQTVIHELLHCKYNLFVPPESAGILGVMYDSNEHMLLEQMSKTLLMTRYDLDFEWFKNF